MQVLEQHIGLEYRKLGSRRSDRSDLGAPWLHVHLSISWSISDSGSHASDLTKASLTKMLHGVHWVFTIGSFLLLFYEVDSDFATFQEHQRNLLEGCFPCVCHGILFGKLDHFAEKEFTE